MTYPITRRLGAGLLACAAASLAHATENGQISYPVGVNTVLNGLLPPPGATQFFNYSIYYSADRFAGPHGAAPFPAFAWTWWRRRRASCTPGSVAWGLHDFQQRDRPDPARAPVHASRNRSQDRAGRRDTGAVHAGLCQSCKDFHAFFSPSFAVPTGAYSSSRIANTGLNTYAFLPYLSMSWFPSPRWEVSATTLIEANTRNRATGYQSGSVAVLDYLVGYAVSPRLQLGVQGTLLKQFTDDRKDGVKVGADGFRGQAAGIGPQLRYCGSGVRHRREVPA